MQIDCSKMQQRKVQENQLSMRTQGSDYTGKYLHNVKMSNGTGSQSLCQHRIGSCRLCQQRGGFE